MVGGYDIITGLYGRHERIKTPLCTLYTVVDDGLKIVQHAIRAPDGALTNAIGVIHRCIYNGLSLIVSLLHHFIHMGTCPLRDLVPIGHPRCLFVSLGHYRTRLPLGILQHGVHLGLGLAQNDILLTDDLLVLFNLIRDLKTQFYQQLLQLFPIHNDLVIG